MGFEKFALVCPLWPPRYEIAAAVGTSTKIGTKAAGVNYESLIQPTKISGRRLWPCLGPLEGNSTHRTSPAPPPADCRPLAPALAELKPIALPIATIVA